MAQDTEELLGTGVSGISKVHRLELHLPTAHILYITCSDAFKPESRDTVNTSKTSISLTWTQCGITVWGWVCPQRKVHLKPLVILWVSDSCGFHLSSLLFPQGHWLPVSGSAGMTVLALSAAKPPVLRNVSRPAETADTHSLGKQA